MNSFNTIFNIQIFGASHGPVVGITLDHVPAGIPLETADFLPDLERRKGGQKGGTPRVEADIPQIVSGHFNGYTTGAPLTILFENQNIRSEDYQKQRAFFRPGHADFVAQEKFKGFEDFRGGGHFSARLTTGIVAAGVIAKKILPQITIEALVTEVGGEKDIEKGLQKAITAKDSAGGLISCTIQHVPIGWGEPFWDSVESRMAQAMFSIPAVKGVEFGAGFAAARMFGTEHNDVYIGAQGRTATNHAGGVIGGITNGNDIVFRIALKPTASTPKEQQSYNRETGQVAPYSVKGRHDLCVALRAPVIVEAMAALVLVDLMMLHKARN
ncbi:chorismate synthase [Taibaiella sp. KBW10]|uniref:chorismate synthase n=1 Tax=Taibaiella sp. KBW10 TaxID=2153357 RepID=UPI000F5A298F|nr:chorismate synthase [Taibaiella sp. KBW10]RQO32294.1 chorismate synthase [Taibaiella sp. KBW10]